jgi:KipI family sensor histidine kinase inhibitor
MGGLDPALATPRQDEPRLSIPAGSVGIGGEQTGIYPLASPGGWQLLGRTAMPLFVPGQQPPTLLRPGDRVRFTVERIAK